MRRAFALPALLLALAGGALAVAQSDVFDPEAIAAQERRQLIEAKEQSAEALVRSAALEAQAAAGPAAAAPLE
jgi:hypothetical protein